MFTIKNPISNELSKADKSIQSIVKAITKGTKFSMALENLKLDVYFYFSGKGMSQQRRANENASVAVFSNDGIGNSIRADFWRCHPKIMDGDHGIIVAALQELTITMICYANKLAVRHDNGYYTKDFLAIAKDLKVKIVSRNKVGSNPHSEKLAEQLVEEILAIKAIPVSDGFTVPTTKPKTEYIDWVCATDCDENKLRRWKVKADERLSVKSYMVCGVCDLDIKPVDEHAKQPKELILEEILSN